MKKIYLAGVAATLLLGACGESSSSVNSDALDTRLESSDDIHEASVSFSEGGATNGEEYFSGILAGVVEVDVKFREITKLDEMDATEEKITSVLDTAKKKMKEARAALNLYKNESWPKRAEFHDLTIEWYAAVEALMDDYLYDLAEPMSRPDETWSQEELDFYDEYVAAYEEYLEVDGRWVDFQYEYADANGFTISGTIDEDAMVDEEIGNAESH